MANFNRIAFLYDFLKRLIFSQQLEKAGKYFLDTIPSSSKILIIGGGTGEILKNFNSSHHITYLELSEVMIRKAKKVNSNSRIEFVQADILEWTTNDKFDYVISPFILDCFDEMQLDQIFSGLKNLLNKEGSWIQTDFYPKNRGHKLLINIMYLFFNWATNLKVKKLADFDSLFKKYNFIFKRKALFYHSMVESRIYQKID
ncbi:class I SAM-dependent methyltransferase [Marivirga salinae]|uniref:Class I SAM-dependent methyltransferase n=1 Tax=Marivirga salinarum TaxID=3059078 RepID=A0AA49GCG2_9BACT|nr:class I SAM-dependent methyltransferase [Marivirga sp. BDSF4-3]WKK75918.2 class I SAM-dependent methyltransferase [Marivirga sp. BDSF4-3]